MKQLFIIGHILLSFHSYAQFSCGTVDKPYEKWIEDIGRPELNPDFLQPRSTIYIPVHYHIVSRSSGLDGYPLNYLFFIHCDMNDQFKRNKINIQFYIDTISYVKSDDYFDIKKPEDKALMGLKNTLNHCNIYLVNDPDGACGYVTNFPTMGPPADRSGIFMQASAINFDCSNPGNKTLPHEMGHWLDIRHTFSNWEGQTGYPPNLSEHPRSDWETVDRSGPLANCLTKGDGFCDTDPDYVPRRWKCPYSLTPLTDPNGKPVLMNNIGRNFMSYSDDDCSDTFSPQQAARMVAAMQNYTDRKDLLLLKIPSLPQIGTFSYFYPKQHPDVNARIPRKNLQLKWNALAGTTKYLVTLGRSSSGTLNNSYDFLPKDLLIDTMVTDTFINVADSKLGLQNNTTYFYWKVRAFNKISACDDNVIPKQAFKVRDVNINFVGINPKCNGDKNGQLFIQDSSGSSTNTYKYNGQNISGKQIDNVGAGTHTLEVKLQDGSLIYLETKLVEPAKISATTSYPSNFAATVTAQGGTPPYTYIWSNGKSGSSQTGLAAGIYGITITDKNGCKLEEYTVKINANGTGGSSISSSELNDIVLLPNQVRYGESIAIQNLNQPVQVDIFDMNGKALNSDVLDHNTKWIWTEKTSGQYLVRIRTKSGVERSFRLEALKD